MTYFKQRLIALYYSISWANIKRFSELIVAAGRYTDTWGLGALDQWHFSSIWALQVLEIVPSAFHLLASLPNKPATFGANNQPPTGEDGPYLRGRSARRMVLQPIGRWVSLSGEEHCRYLEIHDTLSVHVVMTWKDRNLHGIISHVLLQRLDVKTNDE